MGDQNFYDRYEVIKELASSRHSKVYLVRHRILDVNRVAKIFNGACEGAERLIQEAHLIKNLRHPHIPVIYDIEQNIGEDNVSVCIIEEYIDGKSLREYIQECILKNDYLNVNEICRISIELCNILEYLHNAGQGILHMDIKPDNIMIDREGKVKLIDFDNAVMQESDNSVDHGSVFFAAPEQYSGDRARRQSDIYSLGMIILFMASRGQISVSDCHDLSGISKRYSQLYHVIKKSIHHEWKLRYDRIEDLRKELQIIINSGGTDKKVSYIIQVAGIRPGVGTTNSIISMAYFFRKNGYSCLIMDEAGNDRLLDEALKGECQSDGTYVHNGISFLPDYHGTIEVKPYKPDIILVDNGCCYKNISQIITDNPDWELNDNSVIRVLVTEKYISKEERKLLDIIDNHVIMINLVSSQTFYYLTRTEYKGKKCYRLPCIYNCYEDNPIFDETMYDFMQDNLSAMWTECQRRISGNFIVKGYERIKHAVYEFFEKSKR